RRRQHRRRVDRHPARRRSGGGPGLVPGAGDLLMRLGFGAAASEIHDQLALVGESVLAVTRTVEQRFRRWPTGPSQEEVKALEHEADSRVSKLIGMTETMFVTPYDRDDLVALAFALDDVADEADNAAELLGLYGVEAATRQSFEL